jgi:ubiquinol-cytochrome c reductase cytochrome c1 subunit
MRKLFTRVLFTAAAAALSGAALAADTGGAPVTTIPEEPKSVAWSFDGPFGTYDRAALQRGFQVYKEVCSACHSLKLVAIRSLAEGGGPGFTEPEVKALAASYMVPAGPNDQGQTNDENGQPLMRAATPADAFPSPFPNELAARAANNGSSPPDLSVIVKAREGHAAYIYSLLTGYVQPPAGVTVDRGRYYNPYFPGRQISMPPPLTADRVTYSDGTKATIEQEAHDVATFLTWAAEPKMEERKMMGLGVMIFLLTLAGLFYLSYRKIWHGHHDVGATGSGGH